MKEIFTIAYIGLVSSFITFLFMFKCEGQE